MHAMLLSSLTSVAEAAKIPPPETIIPMKRYFGNIGKIYAVFVSPLGATKNMLSEENYRHNILHTKLKHLPPCFISQAWIRTWEELKQKVKQRSEYRVTDGCTFCD